jgi:hypothetical protein
MPTPYEFDDVDRELLKKCKEAKDAKEKAEKRV